MSEFYTLIGHHGHYSDGFLYWAEPNGMDIREGLESCWKRSSVLIETHSTYNWPPGKHCISSIILFLQRLPELHPAFSLRLVYVLYVIQDRHVLLKQAHLR